MKWAGHVARMEETRCSSMYIFVGIIGRSVPKILYLGERQHFAVANSLLLNSKP